MGSPEGCRISPAYVPAATLRVASRSYPLRVPMGNQCRDPRCASRSEKAELHFPSRRARREYRCSRYVVSFDAFPRR